MKFPSTDRRARSAVAVAMLAGAAFATVAADLSRNPFEPGAPEEVVVTRTAQQLFEKGLLPDPNGQLVHERMPQEKATTLGERLRQISLAAPFLSVGRLRTEGVLCTAIWLGEQDGQTYLLTAAHCLPSRSSPVMRLGAVFRGWDDEVLADGNALAFIPPAAVDADSHTESFKRNDIAILRLPTRERATNDLGHPLEQPLLHDVDTSYSGPVHFVGYGERRIHAQELTSGRWWGQTERASLLYGGLSAHLFDGKDAYWASTTPGDSGAAWWQADLGYWRVIATHARGDSYKYPDVSSKADMEGVLVANHVDWIRGIYPGVRTLSDRLSVKIGKPFISPGKEDLGVAGGVYFSVGEKDGTRGGPPSRSLSDQAAESVVHTTVLEERTGNRVEVKLRMKRQDSCPDPKAMVELCARMSKPLIVSFHEEDNPELQQGRWVGSINVEVRRSVDNGIVARLPIQLKLDHMFEGVVTVKKPYVAPMRLRRNAKDGSGLEYHYAVQRQVSVPLQYDRFLRTSSKEHRRLLVVLRDMLGGAPQQVVLRARQDMLCDGVLITSIHCNYPRVSRNDKLSISYHAEDNPKLRKGWYRGQFTLDSKPPSSSLGGWNQPYWPVDASALITVDIDTL